MIRTFRTALALAVLTGAPAIAPTPTSATQSAPPHSEAAAPVHVAAAHPSRASAARSHRMEGLASYYANRLDGRRTASGQPFDQDALTAAHRTLPFGTTVKVTNTRNRRSVVVRIIDRGPARRDRVIDLSRAAAARLGLPRAGLAPVTLSIVERAPAKKGGR